MMKSSLVSSRRIHPVGWIFLSMCTAAVPTALAQSGSSTDRPLFHEPPMGSLSTLAAEAPNRLLAVEWRPDGDRFLTYNRAVPGQTIFMRPGGRHQVEINNCLPHLSVPELEAFRPPVVNSGEPQPVKDFVSEQSDITNLHTHGLHVSPKGRADNVLLKIHHGRQNLYTYDLPQNHAPGTHWYHAHLHGSTALQVQGGMAGALIVVEPRGQRLSPPGFPVRERLVFLRPGDPAEIPPQSLPEGVEPAIRAMVETGDAEKDEDDRRAEAARRLSNLLRDDRMGEMFQGMGAEEREAVIDALAALQPDPPNFVVNGLERPVLHLLPGEIQRLRIVNAGSRQRDVKRVWVTGHDIYLAAYDGINLTHLPRNQDGTYVAYNEDNPLLLDPGNRADVFFIPNAVGSHGLMMEGEVRFGLPGGERRGRKFTQELMTFEVSRSDFLLQGDAGQAEDELNAFLKALDENLRRLQGTAPYQSYLKPLTNQPSLEREMVFEIDPPGGSKDRTFYINGRDYNENMAGMTDYLGKEARDGGRGPQGQTPFPPRAGTEEQWTVTNTSTVVHPFHIHVNPFWVYDIVEEDENGNLVSLRDQDSNNPRLNRWQDTIGLPPNGGSVTIRHRFSEFDGLYVLHCHILQHEDRGMMMNVLVVPNNTNDAPAYFRRQLDDNKRINDEIARSTNPYCRPRTE